MFNLNPNIQKDPGVRDLEARIASANEVWNNLHKACIENEAAQFKLRGGCAKCGGRGWQVTWDTMDSMSGCYADYGTCENKECTPATRAISGLDRSYYSKYDRNRGVDLGPVSAANTILMKPVGDLVKALQEELDARMKALEPSVKGCVVKVVSGRKIPKGTVGEVFWMGLSKGAYPTHKLGIRVDGQKDPVWVASANCIAVLPTKP